MSKGLNFALPPKKLRYEDYLINFELLFKNSKDAIKDGDVDEFKSKLRTVAYTSLRFYNRKKKKLENISQDEHVALKELAALENVVIQKADKGNFVLVDKADYVSKMEGLLSDTSKFQPIGFERHNGDLRHILDKEEEIKAFLSNLKDKGVISNQDFAKMVPVGCSPGILYGLCKVHKEVPSGDRCPLFVLFCQLLALRHINWPNFSFPY